MSMVMGKVIDVMGLNFMFIGFALIQFCNVFIVVWFMPTPTKEELEKIEEEANREALANQPSAGSAPSKICSFSVFWFFSNLFFYGISMCLIENFLFVFLVQEFDNATTFLLGLSTAIMCAFEIPVFHWVGPWLEKQPIGNERALTIVLFACQVITALRCILYAITPGTMIGLVLVVGILQGGSFAAMWVASMEYAKRLSNNNNLAKMTSLVNGIYYSLSMGVGSVGWGVIVEKPPTGLGFRQSFWVDSYFMMSWSAIWLIGLFIDSRRQVAAPEARQALNTNA